MTENIAELISKLSVKTGMRQSEIRRLDSEDMTEYRNKGQFSS